MTLPRELAVLIERYLDGDLDGRGRAQLVDHLRRDDALFTQFTAQLDLSQRLADAHAGEDFAARTIRRMTAALPSPTQNRTPSNTERLRQLTQRSGKRRSALNARRWSWTVPVAACLAFAVLGVLLWTPHAATLATVTSIDGDSGNVLVRGARQSPLIPGLALQSDDVVRTGAGTVTVKYPDGTRVRLAASTSVSFAADINLGKHLRLDQGEIHAQVAPQPVGQPLRITTAHGEAEVMGTIFRLTAGAARTRLQVEEGRVRLHGTSPSASALVVTAGRAAISTGASVEWEAAIPQQAVTPPPREVLFVRRSTTTDQKVAARLIAAGFRIVDRTDASVTAEDARGKALVLISEQVSAQALGTRLHAVEVPLMVSECGLYPALGMTSSMGTATSSRTMTLLQPQHPLSAGLSGTVAVTRVEHPLSAVALSGVPDGAAIATVPASGGRRGPMATIIAFERGQVLSDGSLAPARRVGFFLSGALEDDLTPAGWALFDAAVAWCAGPAPPVPPPPSPSR